MRYVQAEKLYYQFLFIVILICHLCAGVQFWLKSSETEVPSVWIGDFYVLLGLSLAFSLFLFVYRETKIIGKILFGAKLVAFVIIGYGEGSYLGIEFSLLTLIIIETSAYFQLIYSIIVTSVITIVTLFNQQAIQAWGITFSGASSHDIFSLAVYASLVSVFANALHVVVEKLDVQRQDSERLDRAVLQLIEANMGFQQYAVTSSERSVVSERKRISRDIHDTAVHTFMNVIMLTESAIDVIVQDNQKLLTIMQQIIAQSKQAVSDTRQALRELRAIEQLSPKGIKAIYRLVKMFQEATGVQVNVEFGNLPWNFDEEIEEVIYRMIQEGLTNAFRHGEATLIAVRFWIFGSELIVRIHDNGKGTQNINKGIGLQGMEERIQKIQGRLEIKNLSDGFEVTAWIPFLHNLKDCS